MRVILKSVMREGMTLISQEVRSFVQGAKVEKYFCASAVGKFANLERVVMLLLPSVPCSLFRWIPSCAAVNDSFKSLLQHSGKRGTWSRQELWACVCVCVAATQGCSYNMLSFEIHRLKQQWCAPSKTCQHCWLPFRMRGRKEATEAKRQIFEADPTIFVYAEQKKKVGLGWLSNCWGSWFALGMFASQSCPEIYETRRWRAWQPSLMLFLQRIWEFNTWQGEKTQLFLIGTLGTLMHHFLVWCQDQQEPLSQRKTPFKAEFNFHFPPYRMFLCHAAVVMQ